MKYEFTKKNVEENVNSVILFDSEGSNSSSCQSTGNTMNGNDCKNNGVCGQEVNCYKC